MNGADQEATPVIHRRVLRGINRVLGYGALGLLSLGVILVVLVLFGNLVLLQVGFALVAGWVLHAVRALPGFLVQWQAAGLPMAALVVAWWTGHRLIRWWLSSRANPLAQTWTARRTAALLGLVLLGGAAAVATSGVAHQMMWLGQTKWTQGSRRTELTSTLNDTRQMLILLMEFAHDHGRLPNSWEEVIRMDVNQHNASLLRYVLLQRAPPALTHPGADWAKMNPATIVLISELVDDRYVLGMADGAARSVTPEVLDAILASGEMRFINPR